MRVLDLCSGAAGGWSLGLHRAGMTTVAACEAVDWRRDMFAANFPGVKLYDDLRTLTGDQVRRDTGSLPDLVAGSPPCKEYSAANTRGRGLDADDLFMHAVRLVDECRPRWCAFENSDRVRARGYDRIASALEALRYTCWPLVVGVGSTGASHQRKRLILIGLDADAAGAQGRAPRQSRMDPDADRADRALSGPDRRWRGRGEEADRGTDGRLVADADENPLRVECGLGGGREAVGQEALLAGLSRVFRGPVGTADLGRHLRAYAGVSGGVAERCREAYGDAVSPQVTEAVGRAILQVDAALSGLRRAA